MSCVSPVKIQSPIHAHSKKYIYVPCGKCAWCRRDKRNEWCLRFEVEQKDNLYTDFITLTYDEEHIPINIDDDGVCEMRASKDDVQKFIKRLRKQGHNFKYFIVSELGPKNKRPHYHGIFFSNERIPEEDIQDKWGKGFTSSYPATPGAMRYVTKYILKGNDRDNNFMLCSKRPSIGAGYVKESNALHTYRKTEDGVYQFSMPVVGGQLMPMPRYYKKKFKQFFDELDFETNQVATIKLMEQRDKYYYLERKYKDKGGLKDDSNLDDVKDFQNVIKNNYLRDYKKQTDINGKDNLWIP